jgi:hypothetical protein
MAGAIWPTVLNTVGQIAPTFIKTGAVVLSKMGPSEYQHPLINTIIGNNKGNEGVL